MKKLLVVLLALCAVASAAFAQLTANGYVRAAGTYSGTASTLTYADRLRLNLSYTSDDKNVYVYSRLQGSSTATTLSNADIAVKYLYGALTFGNGMFKLTGGMLGNWDYRFSTGLSDWQLGKIDNNFDYIDGIKGFQLEVFPIAGLKITGVVTPSSDITAGDFYGAAMYTIDGVGTILADVKPYDDGTLRASGNFKYTGVAGLGAALGYKYNTTTSSTISGNTNTSSSVYSIIDYTTGAFTAQLAPAYLIDKSGVYVEGFGKYKLNDSWTFALIGAYDQNGYYLINSNTAKTSEDKVFGGLETYYYVGKGHLEANFYYGDYSGFTFILSDKIAF